MSAKDKQQNDFSDLSHVDAVALVANTAIVARDSGHNVQVKVASIKGERGIVIFMPGYHMVDGRVLPLVANPLVANEEDENDVSGTSGN